MFLLGTYHFCPLLCPSLHEMFPWYLSFLEEICSLSHSIVFLYFFVLITEEGFLFSPCYSFELCIQMGMSFLFSFAFCFSSFHSCFEGLLRQPFAFLHFIFLGMVLITASCTMSQTSFLSSSGTLSIRSNPLNLSLPLYNCKGFDLGHTWMAWWFSLLSSI